MPWMDDYNPGALRRDAEKAMSLPLGLASPMWLAFGAAASAGVAWWWMSRLGRPFNLEAKAAATPAPAPTKTPHAEAPPVAAVVPVEIQAPVAESQAPREATLDDLTLLAGIGPRIASALAERGVTRFSQLAAWTADDLAAFDSELNLRGRGHRSDWIGQAKSFATQA